MNWLLWIAQFLLALLFGMGGFSKVVSTENFAPLSAALTRFIGISELLGALGLILPGLTGVWPRLTTWAAGGLGTIMVLATGYHLSRGEFGGAAFTLILLAISVFIAHGRATRRALPVRISRKRVALSIFLLSITLGCQARGNTSIAAGEPPPPVVSVVTVKPQNTPICEEYAAQTFSRDMVEVRGRVDGYIDCFSNDFSFTDTAGNCHTPDNLRMTFFEVNLLSEHEVLPYTSHCGKPLLLAHACEHPIGPSTGGLHRANCSFDWRHIFKG